MHETFIADGVLFRPHTITAPLDHAEPDGPTIEVYARELVRVDADSSKKLPWMVFLQGGPGYPSPRATGRGGWVKRALRTHRLLLLDQRGTGHSTPVTHQTLAHLSPQEQAAYLQHFRAPEIVRDAELFREHLGVERWSLMGQSFGGFCAFSYLSFFPDALERVYLTGGVPPVFSSAEELYEATYPHVRLKNERLFEHLPHVRAMAREIADHLHAHEEFLPNGQRFTPEQFQLIGIGLGRSHAHVPMAFLLEDAFVDLPGGRRLSYAFLDAMLARQSTQTNPIYAILHEAIYCDPGQASEWAAHRVRQRFPEFNDAPGAPFWFTGEMIYPWMFDQLKNLQPLKDAAELLAKKDDWGPLYDPEQLAKNTVPLACMVYAEDMYVDARFSQQVLAKVPKSRAWISNEYEHNGVGVDGDRILARLMTMADDIARFP